MNKKPIVGASTKCQVCGSSKLESILNYGHHPRVHGHFSKARLLTPEIRYPLHLMFCQDCNLVQTNYAVDPKIVFPKDYPYHTGTTNMLIKNFQELAKTVCTKYSLTKKDLVIDIGSNDGTLLRGFKEFGCKVLGIEPTDNARVARANGIPTIQKFFNLKTTREIIKKYGHARVVTAANVFAHINDIYGLTEGIKLLLGKNGVFISESQYLLDVIEKVELDTVYDEHLRYYSLGSLVKLFKKFGMSVIDAERIASAGGSIRAYAVIGKKPMSERALKILEDEKHAGLDKIDVYRKFASRATQARFELTEILSKLKKEGAHIVGLGAPGRGNTLLNFMHIDKDILDYTVERNTSPKIGLYTPGTLIPICADEELFANPPDYLLVLSWHIGDELMKKMRELGYKGSFIIPLPKPRIIR